MLALIMAVSLNAAIVTVQYTGEHSSTVYGGVYIGPYGITIDGIPTEMICGSYDRFITPGQTWQANLVPLLDPLGGPSDSPNPFIDPNIPGNTLTRETKLRATAWLADTLFQGTLSESQRGPAQQAVQWLNGTYTGSEPDTVNMVMLGLMNANNVNVLGMQRLVPLDTSSGGPQIGITPYHQPEVPEPATMVLAGTALAGIGFLKRRRC